jgi:hypothetical protein
MNRGVICRNRRGDPKRFRGTITASVEIRLGSFACPRQEASMRIVPAISIALSICNLIGCGCPHPQANHPTTTQTGRSAETGSYDPALVQKVNSMQKRLCAEAATQPAHAFAGEYSRKMGMGWDSITIGPSGEYTYFEYGCLGLYGMNYGTVKVNGNAIELEPKIPHNKDVIELAGRIAHVRWDKRTYLVEETQLNDFVEMVNKGYEPRGPDHWVGYLKEGDEQLSAEGDPDLPPAFRGRLLPIQKAKVIQIGKEKVDGNYVKRDITLRLESKVRLTDKMYFTWFSKGRYRDLWVKRATNDSCIVEIAGDKDVVNIPVGAVVWRREGMQLD